MTSSGAPTVEHPHATAVLVLGVLGLLCCGLTGPIAWVMGKRTMNEIDRSNGAFGGRAQANIGYVLGIITTIFMVAGFLLWILMIFGNIGG